MSPYESSEEPKNADTKTRDGVVQAPVEPNGDIIPQGAVFTEVATDTTPRGSHENTHSHRAPIQDVTRTPHPHLPAAAAEVPQPAAKTPAQPTQPKSQAVSKKPTLAIAVAVCVFLLLAVVAYLAYAQSN